jgi:DHA1 family bicyclomycin/chloramphenicol resistance-like MFS transporter
MTSKGAAPANLAGIRAGRATLIVGSLTTISPFATDMYLSSFPTLARLFHTGPGEVQATLSAYIVGMAMGQAVFGPLADRFGRRGPMIAGMALYAACSFLITAAPNIEMMIGLRFLQAFGACSGVVIGRAVVRDLFEGRQVASAMSMLSMIQSIGPILAPVLGGYIFAAAGWKANFTFLGAIGLACLAGIVLGLPETMDKAHRRSAHPMAVLNTYVGLLGEPEFLAPALCSAAALSGLFSYISASPFVFLELHRVSPRQYGWLFGVIAIASVASSQLNRVLLRRMPPMRVLFFALAGNILAGAALVAAAPNPSILVLMGPLWVYMATVPLIAANATAIAMAPTRGRAGSASSLIGAMQWGSASVVSLLVGLLHNGTAYPMTVTMAACAAVAVAAFVFVGRLRPT